MKRPVYISMIIATALLLSACGKGADATGADEITTESIAGSTAERSTDSLSADAGLKTESTTTTGTETDSDHADDDGTSDAKPAERSETSETEGSENGDSKKEGSDKKAEERSEVKPPNEILHFVDAFGKEYETEILPNVPKCQYDKSLFRHEGNAVYYDDPAYETRLGVDVSHHQGYIDWNAVAAQGYEFAIIRIAYRGYGQEGKLSADREYANYIRGAHDAGMDVGVYIFSQAISETEAIEEADFVLSLLEGYDIELPIVYDPESILDDVARTDNVTKDQFTRNSFAFCERIKTAGYHPMIYANMKWEAFQLDMPLLTDNPFWYADYEDVPQTPYAFECWQYTNEAHIDGISGNVDLDIYLKKK